MAVRRLLWGLPIGLAIALAAAAGARGPAVQRGTVLRAVDGDTVVVRLASGRQLRARLAGVSAPAAGDCFGTASARRLTAVARGRRAAFTAAGNGRWYVSLPGVADLGRSLLADGFVQADVWGPSFSRFPDYVTTEQLAQTNAHGLWRACTTDVSVTLQPVKPLVATGANAAFELAVANTGALAASGVAVDLRPPPGSSFVSAQAGGSACTVAGWHATCEFGTLAPGATAKGTVVVKTSQPGVIAARAFEKFAWCVRSPCGTTPVADSNRTNDISGGFLAVGDPGTPLPVLCDPSYPQVCIPPPPPRLECNDIPYRNFQVRRDIPNPDPQHLDNNEDGVGCTFDDY